MIPDLSNGLYIGLISGTSADAIDAALVRFRPQPEVLLAQALDYPDALRQRLIELGQQDAPISLDELGRIDHQVARAFADAAQPLLAHAAGLAETVVAIGSHGQTVRHRPQADAPFTMQLGDPSLIAERCGCTVVADFRRRDMAAGGQGAPLLPALHAAVFRAGRESRAVLNLGGIANLTLLPVIGPVRGFDTGPASALMDAWCLKQRGAAFDRDGEFAARGQVIAPLLGAWLDDPWFALAAPKSTGREYFHLHWAAQLGGALESHPAEDVQATLLALTVDSVAQALIREQPDTRRLIVCGGGVHNPRLLAALAARLPGVVVESSALHGLDPDWVEAVGFAWLARQTLLGLPGNLAEVTGARGTRVLGGVYPGQADATNR